MKNTNNIDFDHVKRLYENGKDLIDEAEILRKYNKERRALFLYFTAYEQFYKALMALKKEDTKVSHSKTLIDLNGAIEKAMIWPRFGGHEKVWYKA